MSTFISGCLLWHYHHIIFKIYFSLAFIALFSLRLKLNEYLAILDKFQIIMNMLFVNNMMMKLTNSCCIFSSIVYKTNMNYYISAPSCQDMYRKIK